MNCKEGYPDCKQQEQADCTKTCAPTPLFMCNKTLGQCMNCKQGDPDCKQQEQAECAKTCTPMPFLICKRKWKVFSRQCFPCNPHSNPNCTQQEPADCTKTCKRAPSEMLITAFI